MMGYDDRIQRFIICKSKLCGKRKCCVARHRTDLQRPWKEIDAHLHSSEYSKLPEVLNGLEE